MNPVPAEELAVVDFVVYLLTLLDYVPRTRMIHNRVDIPLTSAESIVSVMQKLTSVL